MANINNKIDHHVSKERRKTIITYIMYAVITVPILLFLFLPNMGETTQIEGVVISLLGMPTDEGQNLYLIVKLKNGDEVKSYISNSSFYKKGLVVKLEKQDPLVFGRPVYRFRGYVAK